jgi:hypothetical protein
MLNYLENRYLVCLTKMLQFYDSIVFVHPPPPPPFPSLPFPSRLSNSLQASPSKHHYYHHHFEAAMSASSACAWAAKARAAALGAKLVLVHGEPAARKPAVTTALRPLTPDGRMQWMRRSCSIVALRVCSGNSRFAPPLLCRVTDPCAAPPQPQPRGRHRRLSGPCMGCRNRRVCQLRSGRGLPRKR